MMMLLLGVLLTYEASGQLNRSQIDKRNKKQQHVSGMVQPVQNSKQLERYQSNLREFDFAFNTKNINKLHESQKKLLSQMRIVIQESERKILRTRNAVNQSNRRLQSGRKEVKHGQTAISLPEDTSQIYRNDQQAKQDDRQKLHHDQMAMKHYVERLNRQKKILATLERYTFSLDSAERKNFRINRRLFEEFSSLMVADLSASKMELIEGPGELTEDQRMPKGNSRKTRQKN